MPSVAIDPSSFGCPASLSRAAGRLGLAQAPVVRHGRGCNARSRVCSAPENRWTRVTQPGIDVDLSRTLGSELERAAEADPDRLLVRFQTGDVSPGRLELRSGAAAGALQAWGIGRGDRVAVMMGNVPEILEAWFGIARLGAIEVPVHSAYKGPLLEHVLGQSESSTLFCDAEFVPRLR